MTGIVRPPPGGTESWADRRLTILYETARTLADAESLGEAVPQILKVICDTLGWEYGALWKVDARAGVLRCVATWSSSPQAFRSFADTSRQQTFPPGIGLPGRVWASGRPAWIPDVLHDDNFPRGASAASDGLHAALGLPLIVGAATRGAMEFFSREIREPDHALLELFGAIGRQIGVFITRKSAQDDLDRFFTLSLELLCIANTAGYFVRLNPQWTHVTGYTESELQAAPYIEFIHPDDRESTLAAAARLADGDSIVSFENRYRCRDGRYRWLQWTSAPFVEQGLVYASARDVTDRREAEDALRRYARQMAQARQAQEENAARLRQLVRELDVARRRAEEATAAKAEFLANMSHEIRTPMNAVLGMTQLLARTGLSDDQRELVNAATAGAESLLDLVNDILDFSKIEARRLQLESVPFVLRDVVADALRLLAQRAHEKGLDLTWHVASDVPAMLVGDPGRLRQVLLNLVGNAIKFTDRGEVVVGVAPMGLEAGGVRLHFTVRDTGIGVPADKQWQVFGAFIQADGSTTRKYGGTGLGLTISAELVELMHGRLWIDSAEGEGSTFHFSALFAQPSQARPAARPPSRAPHRSLKVLLAEDNLLNQKVAAGMLVSEGHHLVVVDNGRDAVDAVRGQPFDVVLMDLQMPHMDGLEATAAIREHERAAGGHVPIIAMTAHALTGDRERCLAAGMDGYVAKPLRISDVLATMAAAADRAAQTPQRPDAPVDATTLLHEAFGGNADLLAEVIDAFLADVPVELARVQDLLASGEGPAVVEWAHKMKGTIGLFTNGPALAAAAALEAAMRRDERAHAGSALTRLHSEVDALSAELRQARQALPTSVEARARVTDNREGPQG